MKDRYTLDSVRKLVRNPSRIPEAVRLFAGDIPKLPLAVNRRWYRYRFDHLGDEFVDEAWDNLLILDAARADIFRDLGSFPGAEIGERFSPGSSSFEFMESQFLGRDLHDTIYVTTNPHVHGIPDGVFFEIRNLLQTDWDPELETVPPEAVVRATRRAHEEHPDKRLIAHFMQPHFPFLGDTGRQIPAGFGKRISSRESPHPWKEQMWGDGADRSRLLRAYRENHQVVVPHAETLVEDLPGRTVVTADHANLVGERGFPIPIRMYGHPVSFPYPELLRVPWIEFDGEPRETVAESPKTREPMADDAVTDRLRSLGYT